MTATTPSRMGQCERPKGASEKTKPISIGTHTMKSQRVQRGINRPSGKRANTRKTVMCKRQSKHREGMSQVELMSAKVLGLPRPLPTNANVISKAIQLSDFRQKITVA